MAVLTTTLSLYYPMWNSEGITVARRTLFEYTEKVESSNQRLG